MFMMLQFVCQHKQSIAEMNFITNEVVLTTKPNLLLKDDEMSTCQTQSGKTAIYTITIGTNTFRSDFTLYNPFQSVEITLQPITGSTIKSAQNFFIASYSIEFLENELIQQGTIGQLLATVYDLNHCFLNQQILFETFQFIQPSLTTNPNCMMNPTDFVQYTLSLEGEYLYSGKISNVDFKFADFSLEKFDCKEGTDKEQINCKNASEWVSSSNFVNLTLDVMFPKGLSGKNKFTDLYGKDQEVVEMHNFELIFSIQIIKRISIEHCTSVNKIDIFNDLIMIYQEQNEICDISDTATQTAWVSIVASQNRGLGQNSKKLFQLQFYTDDYFQIHQYIDCSTWEISEFQSLSQCKEALLNIRNITQNMQATIIYKLFDVDGTYMGSYIFDAEISIKQNANLQIFSNQICVVILTQIATTKNIIRIQVNVSSSFIRFQNNIIDFSIQNYFQFQHNDNKYCFQITDSLEQVINEMSNKKLFGIIHVDEEQYFIAEVLPLIAYPFFWEGFVFLFIQLAIMLIWALSKRKIDIISQK